MGLPTDRNRGCSEPHVNSAPARSLGVGNVSTFLLSAWISLERSGADVLGIRLKKVAPSGVGPDAERSFHVHSGV